MAISLRAIRALATSANAPAVPAADTTGLGQTRPGRGLTGGEALLPESPLLQTGPRP
jgi:hypothetical protein